MSEPVSAPSLDEACRLAGAGRHTEALAMLDILRRREPARPILYIKIAEQFEALNRLDDALSILGGAAARFPGEDAIPLAAANLLYRANRAADAYALTAPRAAAPGCPRPLRLAHATMAKAAGHEDEARALFEALLREEPGDAVALSNLGGMELDSAQYENAIRLFTRALDAGGDSATAIHLAHACFRAGNLADGWRHYARRFGPTVAARPFAQPRWQGAPCPSDTLLLWGEQGVGEEILYAGMLADAVARAGGRVLAECEARLVPLFARSFPGVTFLARVTPPDPRAHLATLQAPLGDCGAWLRSDFSGFPARSSYLNADSSKTEELRQRYQAIMVQRGLTGKRIGLSWKSKPLRQGDPKSTDFAAWEPVFKSGPHLFINLQYGDCAPEREMAAQKGWPFYTDPAIDQVRALDDYAAQVAAMDLVISVSNTAAHMAGALGVPGRILLPRARGLMWHWFDGRADSPWYPSLRLLRQSQDGDWRAPLAALQAELVPPV